MGYYSFECACTLFLHRDRFDFSEMMLHHIMTVAMIYVAYAANCLKIGGMVMILTDFSDIWVANMKVLYEFGN